MKFQLLGEAERFELFAMAAFEEGAGETKGFSGKWIFQVLDLRYNKNKVFIRDVNEFPILRLLKGSDPLKTEFGSLFRPW